MYASPTTRFAVTYEPDISAPNAQDIQAHTVPAQLATLATVEPGQAAEVRSILVGAGDSAALLRPGDTVLCRGRTSDWLVVELPGRGEVAVHRADARHVQIERLADAR
ncbi:MAG: ferrous iron transport protein A [Gemmatimonadetes bacterium]|nr:ferrous iron transport protein A [Gemmatimonadota bacterium]